MKEEMPMDMDLILEAIEGNGYLGLFFMLWLGIFGIPVPNEVIIMTIGFAASEKVLNPVVTFFVAYSGILAALTSCYLIGRFVGRPLLQFFEQKKRFSKKIDSSLRMIERYHAFSLSLSYFLPGVRNFVPFLYGFSKFSFKSFMIFSYSGAFVWLMLVFSVGYWFNDRIETVLLFGKELLIGAGAIALIVIFILKIIHKRRNRNVNAVREHGPHV